MMHEAALHAIHSFETPSVTVETVESLQRRMVHLAGKSKHKSGGGPEALPQVYTHIAFQART
jgi:hypothetical protein